jgi:hypothetical protein
MDMNPIHGSSTIMTESPPYTIILEVIRVRISTWNLEGTHIQFITLRASWNFPLPTGLYLPSPKSVLQLNLLISRQDSLLVCVGLIN